MKRPFFLFLFFILSAAFTYAQCGDRYYNPIFSDVTMNSDIVYGKNANYLGDTTTLVMDIYRPVGDTETKRPLLIFAHAGFFVAGTKEDGDMVEFCNYFAKKGYVCASISYRLGVSIFEIDSLGFGKAIIRSVQDARAAIRFFRDEDNAVLYGIDTTQIFLGGSSAGAVLALHAGFLTQDSPIQPWVQTLVDDLGGFEGDSGYPGHSSSLKGVISFAGAMVDTSWMVNSSVAVCSTHSKDDPVVPYDYGTTYYLGIPIAPVMGGDLVHQRAIHLGNPEAFLSFDSAGHVPHLAGPDELWETEVFVTDFLYRQLDCFDGTIPASVTTIEQQVKIYPVPAHSHFITGGNAFSAGTAILYSVTGSQVMEENFSDHVIPVIVQPGIYILQLHDRQTDQTVSEKVMVY